MCKWSFRKVFTVGCVLAILQQLTGINVILFYSHKIFAMESAGEVSPQMAALYVGALMIAGTSLTVLLLRYFGRKTLLLFGMASMGVCHVLIGICFEAHKGGILIVGVLTFVALYAISLGPIMWLYNAEIMPAAGLSVATFLNWVFTLGVSFSTPIMIEDSPGPAATFWIYAAFCFIGTIYIMIFVKETKGKSSL